MPARCPSDRQKLVAALRERGARLAIEWDVDLRQVIGEDGSIAFVVEGRDYARAIERAEKGVPKWGEEANPTQLIARLRARLPLADADYDVLGRYLERRERQPRPGTPGDTTMRDCARLADMLLEQGSPLLPHMSRGEIIEYARQAYERTTGCAIDPAQLKARMNRPKSRRK